MLSKTHPINHLYLFGSYTRDEQTKNRDIDILVDLSKPAGLQIIHLAKELESSLDKKIEFVSINGIEEKKTRYIKEDLIDV
ncbi:MAG: nucleotidyltransferase family protein [bacterium]